MTSILFLGLIGIILFFLFQNKFICHVNNNRRAVQILKGVKWFQNYWLSGIFLFFMNAGLFSVVVGLIFVVGYFTIPFVHIIFMIAGVISSFYIWAIIRQAWVGMRVRRIKMALIGSSFYALLLLTFVYMYITLKPSYPGDDTFMAAIGLLFGMIVTAVAFVSCLVFVGLRKNE
ncbi:hypothetical protein [Bacillus sp. 03113]|uniref:hypothetical protein n=1 Tax=Bacillus sp. 03113 TaxID=2578211 RepID=UPI00114335D4|nr:hypothetical protein [Bacillus sp. 03113]